jgi:hypothetical protein
LCPCRPFCLRALAGPVLLLKTPRRGPLFPSGPFAVSRSSRPMNHPAGKPQAPAAPALTSRATCPNAPRSGVRQARDGEVCAILVRAHRRRPSCLGPPSIDLARPGTDPDGRRIGSILGHNPNVSGGMSDFLDHGTRGRPHTAEVLKSVGLGRQMPLERPQCGWSRPTRTAFATVRAATEFSLQARGDSRSQLVRATGCRQMS